MNLSLLPKKKLTLDISLQSKKKSLTMDLSLQLKLKTTMMPCQVTLKLKIQLRADRMPRKHFIFLEFYKKSNFWIFRKEVRASL